VRASRQMRFALAVAAVSGAAIAIGACGRDSKQNTRQQQSVLSVRRPLTAAAATLDIGLDCTQYGGSSCKSGSCLHILHDHHQGYFCSLTCGLSADGGSCPHTWACIQVYPSNDSFVCVPPVGWVSKVASWDAGQ
jgi:hypothetical protein